MSDTPRTDSYFSRDINGDRPNSFAMADFARQLERELAEAVRERDEWKDSYDDVVFRIQSMHD